jgi:pyruvate kinase
MDVVDRSPDLHALAGRVETLWHEVVAEAARAAGRYPLTRADAALSRDNLLAYLALRSRDISQLQLDLSACGLSSLGRLEAHVLQSLSQVLARLGRTVPPPPLAVPGAATAAALLEQRSRALLGRPRAGRVTRVMVTIDEHTVADPTLVETLLEAGMDIARVNCAHGDPATWSAVIAAVRDAEARLEAAGRPVGRTCRIFMDLGGPKIRTGQVEPGPGGEPARIRVAAGDRLRIYRDPARFGHPGRPGEPAGVACLAPAALVAVRPGDRVFIDDGKVAGHVVAAEPGWIEMAITAPAEPVRIRPGKGLNFPDTRIELPALTDLDREHLRFVVEHATVVGLSFVHRPDDLAELHRELTRLGRPGFGIIAKIETRTAIHNLGRILLAGLDLPSFGIMIARGDLAVEVGFEELAFVQDDILCLCEAAHVPVVWATQVLETLARSGLPARAEITDAVVGQRADCVMLNKGPYIDRAVQTLALLLAAEERRQQKKRQLFRTFTEQASVFAPPAEAWQG